MRVISYWITRIMTWNIIQHIQLQHLDTECPLEMKEKDKLRKISPEHLLPKERRNWEI